MNSNKENFNEQTSLYNSGFFLKATLWPDFTELFFRFFGVKKGEFYLTSAKKASGFWRFLNVKNGDF